MNLASCNKPLCRMSRPAIAMTCPVATVSLKVSKRQDAGTFCIQAATASSGRPRRLPILALTPHPTPRRIYARPAPASSVLQRHCSSALPTDCFAAKAENQPNENDMSSMSGQEASYNIVDYFQFQQPMLNAMATFEILNSETFSCLD